MRLSEGQQNFCSYAGLFGILISATCLIQLWVYSINHWLVALFSLIYLFIVLSYVFLALQRNAAWILLIISLALSLLTAAYYLAGLVFSVIVTMLFIYTATITIVFYMYGLPAKLRQKELARRAEENEWRGKL